MIRSRNTIASLRSGFHQHRSGVLYRWCVACVRDDLYPPRFTYYRYLNRALLKRCEVRVSCTGNKRRKPQVKFTVSMNNGCDLSSSVTNIVPFPFIPVTMLTKNKKQNNLTHAWFCSPHRVFFPLFFSFLSKINFKTDVCIA